MSTRVAYSKTGVGQEISGFVNDVQTALARGRRLKAKLDSMSFGDDWTAVEAEVGGMVAGGTPQSNGQILWVLIATAMTKIDSPEVAELARLDQQG